MFKFCLSGDFPAQRCFSTALVCGTLIPCPKSSSMVTVDRPVSSADGLYSDMPPRVLISSGFLEFISTHTPQHLNLLSREIVQS